VDKVTAAAEPAVHDVAETAAEAAAPVAEAPAKTVQPVVESAAETSARTVRPAVEAVAKKTDGAVRPVVQTVAQTTDGAIRPVVETVAQTTSRTVGSVVQTAVGGEATPAVDRDGGAADRPSDLAVSPSGPRGDEPVAAPSVEPVGAMPSPRRGSVVDGVEPVLGATRPLGHQPARQRRVAAPAVSAQRAAPVRIVASAPSGVESPGVPAVVLTAAASTEIGSHAARAASAPDSPAAGSGGSAATGGAPSPAPSGTAVALGLAALSLAAGLVLTRLRYPPAHWRPVFLVSLIERPG
jgi:hypothetical protein